MQKICEARIWTLCVKFDGVVESRNESKLSHPLAAVHVQVVYKDLDRASQLSSIHLSATMTELETAASSSRSEHIIIRIKRKRSEDVPDVLGGFRVFALANLILT